MIRLHRSVVLSLLVATVSACSSHPPEPLADDGPRGGNPKDGLITGPGHSDPLLPEKGFYRDWATSIRSTSPATAVYVTSQFVFVYTKDNHVSCIEKATGEYRFFQKIAEPGEKVYPPAVMVDWIVFPTALSLEVFDFHGHWKASIQVPSSLQSSVTGYDERAYFGVAHSAGGVFMAMDTTPDQLSYGKLWERLSPTGAPFAAKSAYYQNFIFTAAEDGHVYGYVAEDGTPLWSALARHDYGFKTDGGIVAPIKADGSGVYVACEDSKLYCLNLNTGELRWTYYSGGADLKELSGPVLTPWLVYLYVPNKGVVAVEKKGDRPIRNEKWVVPTGIQVVSADPKTTYIRDYWNRLMAVDNETGKVQYMSVRKDLVCFGENNNPKDSAIFAVTSGNYLMCIRPIDKPNMTGEIALNTRP